MTEAKYRVENAILEGKISRLHESASSLKIKNEKLNENFTHVQKELSEYKTALFHMTKTNQELLENKTKELYAEMAIIRKDLGIRTLFLYGGILFCFLFFGLSLIHIFGL